MAGRRDPGWWDRWLKDDDNGIEREPKLSVYVQRSFPPDPGIGQIPGSWRLEDGWPIAGSTRAEFLPRGEPIAGRRSRRCRRRGASVRPLGRGSLRPVVGRDWPDQRALDAHALVFETEPLPSDLEVVGFPEVELAFEVDAPLVNWFARLSDVAPDGAATLVTGGGARTATLERGEADPGTIEPGARYRIPIELHATGWRFEAGHRIRLSVSNAMWPMIWPTPYACTARVILGDRGSPSVLRLPVVPVATLPTPVFPPPLPPGRTAGLGVRRRAAAHRHDVRAG